MVPWLTRLMQMVAATNSPHAATTYSAMVPWLTRLMQMVAATNSPHAATGSAIMPVLTRLMQVVAATLRQAVPQLTRGVTISVGVGVSQTGGNSGDTIRMTGQKVLLTF